MNRAAPLMSLIISANSSEASKALAAAEMVVQRRSSSLMVGSLMD
jgi:hypothetical protein